MELRSPDVDRVLSFLASQRRRCRRLGRSVSAITLARYCLGVRLFVIYAGARQLQVRPARTTSASGASASLLSSQIRSANGVVSDSGLQLSAPPLGDLQGLFLHHHQPSHVKREPEDLSHHRKTTDKSRHKVVLVTTAGGHPDLVVDVVNNNNNTTIKDEFIHSPQHGSRSINGTPSSTSSLITGDNAPIEIITTDGLKTEMYNNHIFTAMSNAQPQGSGTPSPIPYSEHATQYTTSVSQGSSGYVTTSAGRGSASSGFADPYYREYFSEQSPYGGTVRQATYADSPEGAGSTAAVNASLMDRYVRGSAYHSTKGVIAAAGLTVDLPSPDSGIGADAITPRDQAAIQQSFDYSEMCGTPLLEGAAQRANPTAPGARSRPWHDFGRQSDADKIQIPKVNVLDSYNVLSPALPCTFFRDTSTEYGQEQRTSRLVAAFCIEGSMKPSLRSIGHDVFRNALRSHSPN
ncbi:Grainyhead-like protein 2 [Homalodisca vitripennis]|nr:Grainyhead-like protein 2 [Homalodisca vitripennis]